MKHQGLILFPVLIKNSPECIRTVICDWKRLIEKIQMRHFSKKNCTPSKKMGQFLLKMEHFFVINRNTQSNDLFHAVIAMPLGAILGNSTNGKALFLEKNRLPIGRPDQHDVGALFL